MQAPKVVIFIFAGREKYMEVQKAQLDKIISSLDSVEMHLWNFTRNEHDNNYLQKIASASNVIRLFNQFYEGANDIVDCIKKVGVLCGCQKCRVGKWSEPYKYYADQEDYANTVFIKIDDDVIFLDHKRISTYIEQVQKLDDSILSAEVINNGICAALNPKIREKVYGRGLIERSNPQQRWWWLCTNGSFFDLSHDHFLSAHDEMLHSQMRLHRIPRTRFSINTIAFNWRTMKAIAENLGATQGMNDEGIISEKFDIHVLEGFVACHLHFSDQRGQISDEKERAVLEAYQRFAEAYV